MKRLLLTVSLVGLMTAPAAAQPAETIEYYGHDVIGSVRIVFNPSGTVLARQDYEPFGRPLFTVPAMPKEGFGAQEKDDETNQVYFHARMFQARTGRFTRVDPLSVANTTESPKLNRFVYTRSNPIRFVDPTGLDEEEGKEKRGKEGKPCDPKFIHCGRSNPGILALAGNQPLTLAGVPGPGAAGGAIGALMALGGRLPRLIGRAGELALERAGGIRRSWLTDFGRRFVDSVNNGVAQESKVGFQTLTTRIINQIDKDLWLLENKIVSGLEWHFTTSPVTGLSGGSVELMQYLANRPQITVYVNGVIVSGGGG